MPYRLFIDEVGNHDLKSARKPNERYLSLTGVMIDLDYAIQTLQPEMEAVKRRHFDHDPDDAPVIFHRKQLAYKNPPFNVLQDPEVEAAFNVDILRCFQDWNYCIFTVSIDKLQMLEQYKVWRYEPYHYCLKILIERYTQCLERRNARGDVLAEARSSTLDNKLKDSYERLYKDGTEYVVKERLQARLTSKQLKVKPKSQNIAGLQLADLLAYPSYRLALAYRNREKMQPTFNTEIAKILADSKYDRISGHFLGIGLKWLP